MKKIILLLVFISILIATGLYFTGSDGTNKASDGDMLALGNHAYQEQRFEDAFTYYQSAANQGLPEAQLRLSQLYQQGKGTEQDEALAVQWLKRAADKGHAQAQYEYAALLEFGRGVARSEMAVVASWYKKSAQKGYPAALLKLAKLYTDGSGLEQDLQQALTLALQAEDKQVANAEALRLEIIRKITSEANSVTADARTQYLMAMIYQDGIGVNQDESTSVFWFRKAAQQGYAEAQYKLAKVLVNTENRQDALHWFKKAAQQGHIQAGYNMAALMANSDSKYPATTSSWQWLYHGLQSSEPAVIYNLATSLKQGKLGLPPTDFKYIDWLEKAAAADVTPAQNDLAVYYHMNQKNPVKSVRWLRKAARHDVKAQFNLGLIYARGDGITPNDDQAIHWWKIAAANGSTRAKLMLGLFYNLGRSVVQSESEAAAWYLKAAQNNDLDAMYNLAVLFYNGIGMNQDYSKAAGYLKSLADKGDPEAQNIYASLFLNGQGVKYSAENAVLWFARAARAGNPNAMFNLASQYRQGSGVIQDDKKALYWYTKAADLGFAPAQNALGYMYAEGRGTKANKETAGIWLQKALDNGLQLAAKNLSALKNNGAFSLVRIQLNTQIRSDILTSKDIDLTPWLEVHQQPILL